MTRDSEYGQPESLGDVLSKLEWGTMIRTCRECGKTWETEGVVCVREGPIYGLCPECEAAHTAQEKTEAEQRERLAREAEWEALCPPGYRMTDPTRLVAEHPLTAKPLADILAWQYGPKGLLAIGPTDGGKTRSMFLLVKRLFDEGRDIRAFDCADFGHICFRRFMDGTGPDWVGALARVEVCFFDDFGKMPLTERVEAELSALIERRTANELPILATSNMTGAALMSKASQDRGAPMVRRLREFCEVIVFEGEGD